MPAKKQSPKSKSIGKKRLGSEGVYFDFPQGASGPMSIQIDLGDIPRPSSYYYADAFHLGLDSDLRMAILSFGRRKAREAEFEERIEVVMPAASLFDRFWKTLREVEVALDVTLSTIQSDHPLRPVRLGDAAPDGTMFANTLFLVVGDGEATLDFYHLAPREIHIAKTQQRDMRIQSTIRVIVSNVLAKFILDTIRPFTEQASPSLLGVPELKLASS